MDFSFIETGFGCEKRGSSSSSSCADGEDKEWSTVKKATARLSTDRVDGPINENAPFRCSSCRVQCGSNEVSSSQVSKGKLGRCMNCVATDMKCSACGLLLNVNKFSSTQTTKGLAARCMSCVSSQAPQPTAEAWAQGLRPCAACHSWKAATEFRAKYICKDCQGADLLCSKCHVWQQPSNFTTSQLAKGEAACCKGCVARALETTSAALASTVGSRDGTHPCALCHAWLPHADFSSNKHVCRDCEGSRVKCVHCHRRLGVDQFSSSQLLKKTAGRSCRECVGAHLSALGSTVANSQYTASTVVPPKHENANGGPEGRSKSSSVNSAPAELESMIEPLIADDEDQNGCSWYMPSGLTDSDNSSLFQWTSDVFATNHPQKFVWNSANGNSLWSGPTHSPSPPKSAGNGIENDPISFEERQLAHLLTSRPLSSLPKPDLQDLERRLEATLARVRRASCRLDLLGEMRPKDPLVCSVCIDRPVEVRSASSSSASSSSSIGHSCHSTQQQQQQQQNPVATPLFFGKGLRGLHEPFSNSFDMFRRNSAPATTTYVSAAAAAANTSPSSTPARDSDWEETPLWMSPSSVVSTCTTVSVEPMHLARS